MACLVGWLVGWSGLVGCLVDWLPWFGGLFGWAGLVGYLVGWLPEPLGLCDGPRDPSP
jgi:hypothetical protein